MKLSDITVEKLIKAYDKHNYQWFTTPYKINLFGIRDTSNVNTFNDAVGYCYHNEYETPVFEVFQATTDPGLTNLKAPQNSKGCAILVEGQYIDGWQKGLHKGRYVACVQNTPVKVYRDNNRNSTLDCDKRTIDTGFFGINIHRANDKWKSVQVDGWSAGCQVIADPDDFAKLMKVINECIKKGFSKFTYTLFTTTQFGL